MTVTTSLFQRSTIAAHAALVLIAADSTQLSTIATAMVLLCGAISPSRCSVLVLLGSLAFHSTQPHGTLFWAGLSLVALSSLIACSSPERSLGPLKRQYWVAAGLALGAAVGLGSALAGIDSQSRTAASASGTAASASGTAASASGTAQSSDAAQFWALVLIIVLAGGALLISTAATMLRRRRNADPRRDLIDRVDRIGQALGHPRRRHQTPTQILSELHALHGAPVGALPTRVALALYGCVAQDAEASQDLQHDLGRLRRWTRLPSRAGRGVVRQVRSARRRITRSDRATHR